jgi:hypothetical protein
MSEINNNNLVLEWNDSIENDGQEFILLPEGDYNFTVIDFERGRFNGSAKIPACNKAIITVQVESKEGIATVKFDLILYRSLEFRLSGFFRSVGQKKHGEKLQMDWTRIIGKKGRAHFKQRSYVNINGEEKFVNDIDRFIDYNEDFFDDLPF